MPILNLVSLEGLQEAHEDDYFEDGAEDVSQQDFKSLERDVVGEGECGE